MGKCIVNLNFLIFKILLYKKNHPKLIWIPNNITCLNTDLIDGFSIHPLATQAYQLQTVHKQKVCSLESAYQYCLNDCFQVLRININNQIQGLSYSELLFDAYIDNELI